MCLNRVSGGAEKHENRATPGMNVSISNIQVWSLGIRQNSNIVSSRVRAVSIIPNPNEMPQRLAVYGYYFTAVQ